MKRNGFTLIELITVIALMGVLITLGMVFFGKISSSWRVTRAQTDLDERANVVFSLLRQDINHVMASSINATKLNAINKKDPKTDAPDNRITLPILMPDPRTQLQKSVFTTYYIDRSDKTPILVRIDQPMNVPQKSKTNVVQKIAEGISGLQFEYSDDGLAWKPVWTSQMLPRMIRTSLILSDQDVPGAVLYRKATFTVPVQ